MNITHDPNVFKVDVKRLHVPVVIKDTCPKCSLPVSHDFHADRYLSYPKLNGQFRYTFCCIDESCEHEWDVAIVMRVTLESPPSEAMHETFDHMTKVAVDRLYQYAWDTFLAFAEQLHAFEVANLDMTPMYSQAVDAYHGAWTLAQAIAGREAVQERWLAWQRALPGGREHPLYSDCNPDGE